MNMSPFTPDYKALPNGKIVDAAVVYNCPYTWKTFILVIQNAPFIMREGNVVINKILKIQAQEPTKANHSLLFPDAELRIPLSLMGIFSYFPTRKPTTKELNELEDILALMPDASEF